MLPLTLNIQPVRGGPSTWTVDDDGPADFSSIQEAINSPLVVDGDTIYVHNGTYNEQLVVNKTVVLIGESKKAEILDYISVAANDTVIQGFTIHGGILAYSFFGHPALSNITIQENALVNGGVAIDTFWIPPDAPHDNNTITENYITNASYGIRISGGLFNKIINNTLVDNEVGIFLGGGNTTVTGNHVEGGEVGIHIQSSNNNLSSNEIIDNTYNFGFSQWGVALPNSIDNSNTINDRQIYFLVNQSNTLISPANCPNLGYLALVNCKNVTVKDLVLSGNGEGILLQGGEGNTLLNNTLNHNVVGLKVISSNRTKLVNNTMSHNGLGLWLKLSNLNTISGNELRNNSRTILDNVSSGTQIVYGQLRYGFGWSSGSLNLWWSSSNQIVGNTMVDSDYGFFMVLSSNNTLRNNVMVDNLLNFALDPARYSLPYFIHDIDDSNTVDGKPVIYWVNEHGRQVPQEAGYVAIVNSSDITIRNVDINTACLQGIFVVSSNNTLVADNRIAHSPSGIVIMEVYDKELPLTGLHPSINITVYNNVVTGNGVGVTLRLGEGYTVSRNNVSNNQVGICVSHAGNNTISGNTVMNNTVWYSGIEWALPEIWFAYSPVMYGFYGGIVVETSGNVVVENTVGHNFYGMCVGMQTGRGNNSIYHNNFINNTIQIDTYGQGNVWNNNFEGNYWSNYTGVDANHDGIGDSWHLINQNNTDNHPLMGVFSSFNTSLGDQVNVISNSTVEDFEYSESESMIKMRVASMTPAQTYGFGRVSIPHELMNVSHISVVIDGGLIHVLNANYSLSDNGTHRWIYFAYPHSTREIVIQDSSSSDTTPPIISILSPENKSYRSEDVPLTFTLSEATSWIGYSLDGQSNCTITGNIVLDDLSDGMYYVVVYANDTAGNMGASSMVYFTVDTISPSISVLSPENKTYSASDVPLTFTVDEATSWIRYSLDGQANMTVTENGTLTELSIGAHSLVVYASDLAGNIGISDVVYFTVLDVTPPNISIVSPENKTYAQTEIPLNFTVDEAVLWMAYSIDDNANVTISGNMTLSGLAGGSHSLTVYARDHAGNTGASDTVCFTVEDEPFPLVWVLLSVMVVIATLGIILYLFKIRKKISSNNQQVMS